MTNSPTRLVIRGPQGVGKGTQAAQLATLNAVGDAVGIECTLLRRLDLAQRARLDRTVMINSAEYRSAVALGGPK